jgi:hypothetical protein
LNINEVLHERFELIPSLRTERRKIKQLLADFSIENTDVVAILDKKWWDVWCSYVEFDSASTTVNGHHDELIYT